MLGQNIGIQWITIGLIYGFQAFTFGKHLEQSLGIQAQANF